MGALNFRSSTDFEDIVYILENADNIEEELISSPDKVKYYLKTELGNKLSSYEFEEGLYCHVERGGKAVKVPEILMMLKRALLT